MPKTVGCLQPHKPSDDKIGNTALEDLKNWQGVAKPQRRAIEGTFARLEPLEPKKHAASVFEAAASPGAEGRFRYLFEVPPVDLPSFEDWVSKVSPSADPMFFAVVDKATGRAEGRQALMRIDPAYGVIEIGHIMWGPNIARSRVTTEALFLFADYVFGLGYRRFEWKCNNHNEPSKRAAERFGFSAEGVFRQHMVVKGLSRDTAWFSIIDRDWPRLRAGYQRWLQPENFDASGQQMSKLVFDQ